MRPRCRKTVVAKIASCVTTKAAITAAMICAAGHRKKATTDRSVDWRRGCRRLQAATRRPALYEGIHGRAVNEGPHPRGRAPPLRRSRLLGYEPQPDRRRSRHPAPEPAAPLTRRRTRSTARCCSIRSPTGKRSSTTRSSAPARAGPRSSACCAPRSASSRSTPSSCGSCAGRRSRAGRSSAKSSACCCARCSTAARRSSSARWTRAGCAATTRASCCSPATARCCRTCPTRR